MQVENLGLVATPFGQALRALALTLVEIKFARKSEQIFTVWPPNPSERKLSDVHEPFISQ